MVENTKGNTTVERFVPGSPGVVFFSRGRGRGHAVPDMAIVEELRKLDLVFQIRLVSYGTGAECFREAGFPVIDLGLPDSNDFLETQLRAIRLLSWLRPQLVISHEEFAAIHSAAIVGIPNVFITDFFCSEGHMSMQALRYANEVVFIDEKDKFVEPAFLSGRIFYTGPFARRLAYLPIDRQKARDEIGVCTDSLLISVFPGSWFTEARSPVFDLVIASFDELPIKDKRLIWVAGEDFNHLSKKTGPRPNVSILKVERCLERLMVASDVCITKATRKTAIELASLAIPSISLSSGQNPPDDIRVRQIHSNIHVNLQDIQPEGLSKLILRATKRTGGDELLAPLKTPGLYEATRRLAQHICRCSIDRQHN